MTKIARSIAEPLGDNQLKELNQVHYELDNIHYPVSKKKLIEHFEKKESTEEILMLLRELPEDNYDSAANISNDIANMDIGNFMASSEISD